tara:strand:- start:4969 stop:5382 length:414 start_codon:yes stop_codon:yes gene_type:complete
MACFVCKSKDPYRVGTHVSSRESKSNKQPGKIMSDTIKPILIHELPYSAGTIIKRLANKIESLQTDNLSTRKEDESYGLNYLSSILECCDSNPYSQYRVTIIKNYYGTIVEEACRLIALRKINATINNMKKRVQNKA